MALHSLTLLALAALLTSCAAKSVTVGFELDQYGTMYTVVDGVECKAADTERRKQVQLLVNEYCEP